MQHDFKIVFNVVEGWMKRRRLKLNVEKTECIIFGNRVRLETLKDMKEIKVSDFTKIQLASKIKNLGVIFDRELSMEPQIQSIKGKAIGNLINISRIAKYIDKDCRLKMIHGLVISRIDFCNALYVGLPNNRLRSLQIETFISTK